MLRLSHFITILQTVTAEVDACFALLLRVTREMKRTGDESSDHLLHLDSLVGRLNLQVYSEERFIVGKFDGWPQVRGRAKLGPNRPAAGNWEGCCF